MESTDRKKIRLRITPSQKNRLEYLLEKYKYIVRGVETDFIDFEPENNLFNYTLSVASKSYYYILIETLALNGFNIESNDRKVNEIINQVADKYRNDLIKFAELSRDEKKVDRGHSSLDKLIEQGNYKELIKVSKDITYNAETINLAKSTITLSVTNAIVKSIERAAKHKYETEKTIEHLITVAADTTLKSHNCDQLMEQAGIVAIELCSKSQDTVLTLIKISHLKNLDYLLNIKAATKLGEIIMEDPIKFEYEIAKAVRELNTRWLDNIFDSVAKRLSPEEIELYNKTIDFIKSKRG
jgi:hypothetical protein